MYRFFYLGYSENIKFLSKIGEIASDLFLLYSKKPSIFYSIKVKTIKRNLKNDLYKHRLNIC